VHGEADLEFLRSAFNKLMLNFTWWVNRKDRRQERLRGWLPPGSTTSVFSTAAPRCPPGLPGAGGRHRMDGPLHQNMLELAVEPPPSPALREMASKFVEHFLYIAGAMTSRARRHGTRRTASTTTSCDCDGSATRLRCARWWDSPFVRHGGLEKWQRSACPRQRPRCLHACAGCPSSWSPSTPRAGSSGRR
jgi:hypothetical protein